MNIRDDAQTITLAIPESLAREADAYLRGESPDTDPAKFDVSVTFDDGVIARVFIHDANPDHAEETARASRFVLTTWLHRGRPVGHTVSTKYAGNRSETIGGRLRVLNVAAVPDAKNQIPTLRRDETPRPAAPDVKLKDASYLELCAALAGSVDGDKLMPASVRASAEKLVESLAILLAPYSA